MVGRNLSFGFKHEEHAVVQRSTFAKFSTLFLLLKSFLHHSLNEYLLLLYSFTFLSSGSLYLGILGFESELYFCTLDFCIFNLRQPWRFACLVHSLWSNIFFGVLFSYCITAKKRTKWLLLEHS